MSAGEHLRLGHANILSSVWILLFLMRDILCHVQSAEIDSDVYKWIGFG